MSTRHDCRNIGICIIHRIPNSLENPLANRRCDRNKNLFLFERNKKKKNSMTALNYIIFPLQINLIRMTQIGKSVEK